jgi:hypothetical protein
MPVVPLVCDGGTTCPQCTIEEESSSVVQVMTAEVSVTLRDPTFEMIGLAQSIVAVAV